MRAAAGFMQYRASELAADRILHLVGTFAGVVSSAILVGIAAVVADRPTFSTSLVYSVCLLTMLGCSAAYNLASNAPRREFLRKLDHAAIFLMIAGTYTPFTTCRLNGVWAIGMTAAIWTILLKNSCSAAADTPSPFSGKQHSCDINGLLERAPLKVVHLAFKNRGDLLFQQYRTGAVTGAVFKLICRRGVERDSIVAYLALGWMIMVGVRPMLGSVDARTAILIGAGGVLYSIGVGFHLWRALPFHNAIWHSVVLVAASCHYAAILHGVVLAGS
jgi:hemolysin III